MNMLAQTSAQELIIRRRRAAFNQAIATADITAIGPILARDCVMMTGTDSAVISGRLAQIKVWRREFAAAGRDVYVRTADAIQISTVEPIAIEYGSWDARSPSGDSTASGKYTAKWREAQGDWVIEAEVFVTMA